MFEEQKREMKMKNKYTMIINSSKVDIYGNRYGYITINDNKNDKAASWQVGNIGSGSNERSIAYDMKANVVEYNDIPIRKFNRESKGFPYLNTSGRNEECIKAIKKALS